MRTRISSSVARKRQHQAGMATIVVIAILSILLIFAMGNVRTLNYLGRDLRLLEQQHQHRIAAQCRNQCLRFIVISTLAIEIEHR